MNFQITGVAVDSKAFEIKSRCYLDGIVTSLNVKQNYNGNLTVACLSKECFTTKSIVKKFFTQIKSIG